MNDMSFPSPSPLDGWFSQKPTIALMGEFSAGKSTLLNLILEDDILHTRVTATNMPVVWLTHAETPKAEALSREGELSEFALEELGTQGGNDHLVIRLSLPSEILRRVDIVDTPGISDSRLDQGALSFLEPYLDSVIWCTAANQAWRQTEKAMWLSMPEELRSTSLLALTRADTLRKASDLSKVMRRCEREATDLFEKVLPISALGALRSRGENGAVEDHETWNSSHAPAFLDCLNEMIERAKSQCDARPELKLPGQLVQTTEVAVSEEKHEAKIAPIPSESPAPKKPRTAPKPKANRPVFKRHESKEMDLSILKRELCQLAMTTPQNEQFYEQLDHILTHFAGNKNTSDGHQMVLNLTLPLEKFDDVPKTKLISQLLREFDDFANSPWHKLDKTN